MNSAVTAFTAFLGGIIGLAVLSVLVAPNAKTAEDVNAISSGVANVVGAAVSPVTGSNPYGSGNNNSSFADNALLSVFNPGGIFT